MSVNFGQFKELSTGNYKMFAPHVSAGYCVTPVRAAPFSRLPSRASTIIRDVRRRSMRLRRSASFQVDTTPGTFVRLCEDEVRQKYVEDILKRKVEDADQPQSTPESPLEEEDKENNNFVTPGPRSGVKRRCSTFFSSSKRKRLDSRTARRVTGTEEAGTVCTVRAGYMYKKSLPGHRRKYVVLTTAGLLSYYPSFQAYLDNSQGKHINLAHTTVKIPGQPGPARDQTDTCHVHEMMIVSLDNKTWQFQLPSSQELDSWVGAIEQQISQALGTCPTETHASVEQMVSNVPGNDTCADCGHPVAEWASLNLGTVICIQCSGIHRNLGTHVSRVRSLRLDTWTDTQLGVMRHVGNSLANRLWEAHLDTARRPGPGSSRDQKEAFIREKYVYRTWLRRQRPELRAANVRAEAVRAIREGDTEALMEVILHQAGEVTSAFPWGDRDLADLLLREENLWVSQLLAWHRSETIEDAETEQILIHQPGTDESILL